MTDALRYDAEPELNEPILIIKTAWGGKSLNTDFRPPSAGPYEFNESQLEGFKKQGKEIADMLGALKRAEKNGDHDGRRHPREGNPAEPRQGRA